MNTFIKLFAQSNMLIKSKCSFMRGQMCITETHTHTMFALARHCGGTYCRRNLQIPSDPILKGLAPGSTTTRPDKPHRTAYQYTSIRNDQSGSIEKKVSVQQRASEIKAQQTDEVQIGRFGITLGPSIAAYPRSRWIYTAATTTDCICWKRYGKWCIVEINTSFHDHEKRWRTTTSWFLSSTAHI